MRKFIPCPYCGYTLLLGLLSFAPSWGDDAYCPRCHKLSTFPTRVRLAAELSGLAAGAITLASLIFLFHPANLKTNHFLAIAIPIIAVSVLTLVSSLVCRNFGVLIKQKSGSRQRG